MKLSLVMAVYNGEKYLYKQLDSILKQTKKIDEVILIDDCSKDNSVKVIQSYIKDNQLNNWLLIENTNNLGYRDNFKKGLSMVTGDYIFLCDQDDIWHLDKVEKMISVFTENMLSVASSFEFINQNDEKFTIKENKNKSNNNIIDFKIHEKLTKIDLKYLLRNNFAQGCTMAIKKELVKEYLANPHKELPHDWNLNIIAAIYHGCYFYDERLIDYRIHDTNTIGLDEVEQTYLENKDKRTKNRISYLKSELDNVNYAISLNLQNDDYQMCLRNKEYLESRIEYMQNKQVFKLCKYFISGKYSEFGYLKTFIGDVISILR